MTNPTGDLAELLRATREDNLVRALAALERSGLPHYPAEASARNRERLALLYDVAIECLAERNLAAMTHHAHVVAEERFRGGFGIAEVHTAFNVLEETLWRTLTEHVAPERLAEALGIASTVLGTGKQTLAVEWVALAGGRRDASSLDRSALFRGTA